MGAAAAVLVMQPIVGCGESVEDDDGAIAVADSGLADADLSGVSVTVGSADFDEQLILGNLISDAFDAAGANVHRMSGSGESKVLRTALLAGEIDSYPEYSGVGWTEHLGQEDPIGDAKELTDNVAAMDLENDVVWVGRTPFNRTIGFATGAEITEKNGGAFDFDSMAEFLKDNPDATVCMEPESPSRSDGPAQWEEATGYEIGEGQTRTLDSGLIYTEASAGDCSFGEIVTTDGRISSLDLTLVEDPGVMMVNNVSITIKRETYDEAPRAFDAIASAVLDPLDDSRMAELNAKVTIEDEDPADVARDYLIQEGLIER